jgi:acyl transferase domain-containing protein
MVTYGATGGGFVSGDAVAIIGMACRVPGAGSPVALWRLLCDGVDAVTQVPSDRWNLQGVALEDLPERERAAIGHGGFLDQVDGFDAAFFGISPREATAMDPQQRLMLELSWEALEDAKLLPGGLAGSSTGVFTGAIWDDYATLAYGAALTAHTLTGIHRSIIANRVSYTLGLCGPSIAVDTGQSSSLVAVHLACESLRKEETTLAIAGGVNLNLVAHSGIGAARFGGLSPDGRCFTFDHRANGYVRGEGGGVVVLKPVTRALADGDPIYCVIRGGAVNNDGATDGLTVPSTLGQEQVLRQAYAHAGIDPATVQYVELHGTGTRRGDPVEAAALGAVLGHARGLRSPLLVGSLKTNIGHLEAAAGIAGLIKTVLCIQHREIPRSLHYQRPHPQIPVRELRLRVQTTHRGWPRPRQPLIAGVSCFGMGGTNCHLVISQPPTPARKNNPTVIDTPLLVWPLSAKTPEALAAQAQRLATHLAEHPEVSLADVGYSLGTTRTLFPHRAALAITGADTAVARRDVMDALDCLARHQPHPSLITTSDITATSAQDPAGKTVFVFGGQGSQYQGMGLQLYQRLPVFRDALDACDRALYPYTGWSVLDVLNATPDAPPLERVDVVQPALFAVMTALATTIRHYGIEPGVVIGHSQGEITAAHIAGALSLQDAAKIVALRGQALSTLAGRGAMAAVWSAPADLHEHLSRWSEDISIAAVNSPTAHTVTGQPAAIEELLAYCAAHGVRARRVSVDYASHSAQIDTVRERLWRQLAEITPRPAQVPFYSTVQGQPHHTALDTTALDAEYWYRNLRHRVEFHDTTHALLHQGATTFVEISPHPILTPAITDTHHHATSAEENGSRGAGRVLATGVSHRNRPESVALATALARWHVHGHRLDWRALYPQATPVDLPTYPFTRQRYWLSPVTGAGYSCIPVASASQGNGISPTPRPAYSVLGKRGHAHLLEEVRSQAAAVAGHSTPDAIAVDRTFRDLGFDSTMAVELIERLAATTGLVLIPTLIFDHPTPAALTTHLLDELLGRHATVSVVPVTAVVADDPVVVVGVGCRYPGGVTSPEDLWDVVVSGRDVIGGFPTDRGWDLDNLFDPDPDTPGRTYTRSGGFLDDAGGFDAAFFGISPREAEAMDPQQRVLLEVAREAIERSRIDPGALAGTRTGVFTGVWTQEYGGGSGSSSGAGGYEGYLMTGTASSVASGRIAYTLGLEGPAITVDTACSSSLVAIHLACQSLRNNECDLALAGGATVMATPTVFVEFARQRGLSPDGRCKAFAAAADGTGWGEGAAIVVLQRLSHARAQGHPVLAVIAGSAINQDGASNGLTAPHGPSQQRVITTALANAGLTPDQIDVVEAHGTGTTLGDPIEAGALLATYGQHRPPGPDGDPQPLYLGSVKSNIGHTQAAAGIAGVIKIIQALRHNTLPPTLHIDTPTPHATWNTGTIELLTHPRPWPDTGRVRRAGVSSFGISGTNAHLILQQPPTTTDEDTNPDTPTTHTAAADTPAVIDAPVLVWPLSAKTPEALNAQAHRLAEHLADHPEVSLTDVGYSLGTTRTLFPHRASLATATGADTTDARRDVMDALRCLAQHQPHPSLITTSDITATSAEDPAGKTVFVFSGQGSQYQGMGLELYQRLAVFRDTLDACDQALHPYTGWSVLDALNATPDAPPLQRVDVVQPALFAVMTALATTIRYYGIEPDVVIGHSQGEITAAHIAGALTLEDAAKIVALRSQALTTLTGRGTMAAVWSTPADLHEHLSRWDGRISIAAVNSPTAHTVTGQPAAVEELLAYCAAHAIRARQIPVDYASHSAQIKAVREQLRAQLADITPRPAQVPFYSSVHGQPHHTALDTTSLDADYWYRNLRHRVEFHDTTHALLHQGATTFVEISPHPILTPAITDTLHHTTSAEENGNGKTSRVLATGVSHKNHPEPVALAGALARLHVHGHRLDWRTLYPQATPVDLPTYPFTHQRYWLTPPPPVPVIGAVVPGEARFWKAIEHKDLPALADTLRLESDEARSSLNTVVPAIAAWRAQSRAQAGLDRWRYRIVWRARTATTASVAGGTWLVLSGMSPADHGWVTACSQMLTDSGAQVRRVSIAGNDTDRDTLASHIRTELAGDSAIGVLSLLALDETPHPLHPGVPTGLALTLTLIQALGDADITCPLWVATQGAVNVDGLDHVTSPVQAQVWGLGRSAALECPERWGGLVDLPDTVDAQTLTYARHSVAVTVRTNSRYAPPACSSGD